MRRKDQFFRALLIAVAVLLWVSLSFATVKTPENASWAEHLDLVNIIIGLLFAAVVSLTMRTLNKIDRNQTIIFERLEVLTKDFYILEGKHRAMMNTHRNH
jgi:uncharacterized membrane-anchored protein